MILLLSTCERVWVLCSSVLLSLKQFLLILLELVLYHNIRYTFTYHLTLSFSYTNSITSSVFKDLHLKLLKVKKYNQKINREFTKVYLV